MNRLICRLFGHKDIPVEEVGLGARPGGMLPMLDGYVAYKPAADGDHRACTRCRRVETAPPANNTPARRGSESEGAEQ